MICRACREEVRFGYRDGNPGWLHREEKDHPGQPMIAPQAVEETPLPEVEVPQHNVTAEDFPPRSGIRQVINLVRKQGWDLRRLTQSRGPYIGAKGDVLSISEVTVLAAVGPARLDGGVPVAVGSWRDGSFDFAYIGEIVKGNLSPTKVDATTMKNWIKGIE